jgi:hypothetical protein
MKNIFFLVVISISVSCASYMKEHEYNEKAPSGFTEVITSRELAKMRPIQILNLLKNNCCDGIMFEPGKVTWSALDAEEVAKYVNDKTDSAAASTIMSSVSCRGARYVSSVGREARHLILAIKAGKYPLAQCSTYDLRLEKED